MENVRRHVGIIETFGIPAVVAVNRRSSDTDEEIELVKRLAVEAGAFAACANDGFAQGGAGAAELAAAVIDACSQPASFRYAYDEDDTIQDKVEAVAKRVYGARSVFFYPEAEQKISQFTREGLSQLPACIAKTHLSLSADSSLLNAPEEFVLPVRDCWAYTGAGWLVVQCGGDVSQMPGLGRTPAALGIDIDARGGTIGLG